jgi:hypothetical protein
MMYFDSSGSLGSNGANAAVGEQLSLQFTPTCASVTL